MPYALGVKGPGGGYVEVEGGGYQRSADGRFPEAPATWGVVRAYGEAGADGIAWEPLNMATLVKAGDRVARDARALVLSTAGGAGRRAGRDEGEAAPTLTARKSPGLRG
jgi:hypothetical protein